MINFIEEVFEVYVHNSIIAFMDILLCLYYSLMCITIWTKAIAVFTELQFECRTDYLTDGLLQQAINYGWNA